ncbi:MAG TPA: DUF4097 family beta strand repeat-containing protein [Gemmatimonadales bacterium]|nr:DUF4097 family beta strand repeat-containing protein [Gemmatimonadales bacterium]
MRTPLVVAAHLLVAASPLFGQAARSYAVAGNDVAIYNLAGEVTVRGGSGKAVTVEVTPTGRDAGRLSVDSGAILGVQTLRIVYPSDDILYPPLGHGSNTTLTIRDDGTWGGSDDSPHHRSEGRRIRIRGDGSGLEAAANLVVTVPTGQRAAVFLGVGRVEVANVDGVLRLDAASADVTARQTRGDLRIDTGSGQIRGENLEGSVSLDTGSGDVTLTGHRTGRLDIDTGSGSVNASGIDTPDLKVDTGSGDITLDGLTAPRILLDTGSGSVRASLTGAIGTLSVETGSGDVTLRIPDATSATLDLETGSGDYSLEMPIQLLEKGEGSLRGQLGDGKGRIHIETGSGAIALKR